MKKALQIIGILVVIAVPAVLFGVYALWNKEHRDVSSEKPEYSLKVEEILNAFEQDEEAANKKYIDKAVLITGEYLETEGDDTETTLILKGAACSMKNKPEVTPNPGDVISIQGRVTAYDDLFGDIRLADCTILNKTN